MVPVKDSFCSYCGSQFSPDQAWPRTCATCQQTTYRNPIPVSVLLAPVIEDGRIGVLAVRRNIEPHKGKLALPGGFVEFDESWQAAAAREAQEEANVVIDPQTIREFLVRSAPDHTIIIVGRTSPLPAASLPPFYPTQEATERVILHAPVELAFPLHSAALRQFFASETQADG